MKNNIYTLTCIFFLFILEVNPIQSQPETRTDLMQKFQVDPAAHQFPITTYFPFENPARNRPIFSDEKDTVRSFDHKNGREQKFKNPLFQWLDHTSEWPLGQGEKVHFRGPDSRLDSSYVFVEWLGTDIPFSKIFYSYDDEGRKTKALWVQSGPYFQILYHYDEEGNLSREEQQNMGWNGKWYGWKLIEYSYFNATQTLDTIVISYWDTSVAEWYSWQMEVYTLNNQNLPNRKLTFYKDDETGFILDGRSTYFYNSTGQLTEEIQERLCFQGNSDAWRKINKTSFSYSITGDLESSITARWEIDHWRETTRTDLFYDDYGNLTEEQYFYSHRSGNYLWADTYQEDITYDYSQNMVTVLKSEKGSQQWMLQSQVDSLFNSAGKVTEVVEYTGFCTPLLLPMAKKTFWYGTDGNLEEAFSSEWDFSSGDWKEWQRETHAYNEEGLLENWTVQKKNNNDPDIWEDVRRQIYTYDSLSVLQEKTEQLGLGGDWLNNALTTYSYDSLSRLSEELFHYWNGEIWKLYAKNSFDYNENGHLAQIVNWDWSFDGVWHWELGYIRHTFEYDDVGRPILEEIAYQQYDTGDWLPKYRTHTQYSQTGKQIGRLTEEFKQTKYTWQWDQSIQHFWNEETTPILETGDTDMACSFANPCWPGCLISCKGIALDKPTFLSLYDLMGRLRFQTRFTGETNLDNQVAAGSYVMVITSDGKVIYRDKLLVQ